MDVIYIANGYRHRKVDETLFYLTQSGFTYTREQVLAIWSDMDGPELSF